MPKKVHSGMNILTLKTENTNVEAQIIDVLDTNLLTFFSTIRYQLIAHLDDLCIYHWLFVLIICQLIPTERQQGTNQILVIMQTFAKRTPNKRIYRS